MSTESLMREVKDGVGKLLVKYDDLENLVQQNTIRLEKLEGTRKSKVAQIAGQSAYVMRGYEPDLDDPFMKVVKAASFTTTGMSRHEALKKAGFLSSQVDEVMGMTQKAMDSGTGGAGGGFVVQPNYIAQLIELLRAKATVLRAGATMMQNLNGSPAMVPKQLSSATVSWVGQNQSITATDPGFGQINLTPKTMAIRSQFSNLLNILASPSMEKILRNDFARVAGLELDRVALRGSGTANQPLGVMNYPGISTYAIGTNGGPLTADDLYGLIGLLEDNNAMGPELALITSPKGLRKLKKQRIAQFSGDTGGTYLVQPLLTDEALSKAIGLTCLTTTQLPVNLTKGSSTDCTEVFVANWSELLIGQWGDVEILATNVGGNAWAQNAIEIRLIMNVDIQTRHPLSFVYCADARTA